MLLGSDTALTKYPYAHKKNLKRNWAIKRNGIV